jgi:branched-chain amino acid transport system ATP-binding protein
MTFLTLRNVRKAFGGIVAVDDVSFDLEAGTISGLIGPNGSGKSTLFNLIDGTLRPDRGDIRFEGSDLTRVAPFRRARAGVVRTFQDAHPVPSLTVLDNVALGCYARTTYGILDAMLRLPRARREERETAYTARDCLRAVGLHHLADAPPAELTAGQLRLLSIARALAARPRLLLLDEPAAGLTRTESDVVADLVMRLSEATGLTILLVEHDVELVMGLVQRVIVLDRGRVVADGSPGSVRRHALAVRTYLGAA